MLLLPRHGRVWTATPEQGRLCLDHIFSLCNSESEAKKQTVSFLELQTMADEEFPTRAALLHKIGLLQVAQRPRSRYHGRLCGHRSCLP